MIQRIQSVYLVLAAALMVCGLFLPLATIITPEFPAEINAFGIFASGEQSVSLTSLYALSLVAVLSILLLFINIFMYRNRRLQMRVCHITTLMLLVFYAMLAIYLDTYKDILAGESIQLQAALSIPAVALILNNIAFFRIRSDERLVRSADRLR